MIRFGAELEEIQYEGQPSSVYFGLPMYEKVDIQGMIDDAIAAGEKEITIPRGAYRIHPRKGGAHVYLENVTDFTIHAYDVVLLYQEWRAGGMTLIGCNNVTVEGLSSDYEPCGFSQMRITAIDPDGQYIDFHIDEGYMSEFDDVYGLKTFPTSFYHGVTRRYMPLRSFPVTNSNVEHLGDRNVRVHSPLSSDHKERLHLGDYLWVGARPVLCGNLSLSRCNGCHIKDYTVWSGCVGVGESFSTGKNYYDHFCVVPGPRPYKASEDRVCSTVADAAHMQNNRIGATIENGLFHSMGDDGVNFYGTFMRVAEVISDKEFVLAEKNPMAAVLIGDTLRFYANNMSFVGGAAVASITDMEKDYQPTYDLSKALGVSTFRASVYYRVTLKNPLPLKAGNFVSNTSRNGNGFVLRNNRYVNARPRGSLIKASHGLIENCFYEDLSVGIQIRPEIPWNEAGYAQDVTVRNNTFVHCGTGLVVEGHLALDQRNILIERNTFMDITGSDMHLSSCQDVTVRNNIFGDGNRHSGAKPVIVVGSADGITFENNRFADHSRTLLSVSPAAKNIAGLTGVPYSVASEAVESGVQGHCGWHFGYALIGTHDYVDYPIFREETTCPDGWHTADGDDENYGTVTRLWGDVFMCPGELADAVKTYVCPSDGEIVIGAAHACIIGQDTDDGVRFLIYHNEELLWQRDLFKNELTMPPVLRREVKAGDRVHFRVNKIGNAENDGVDWDPTVLYRTVK